MIEKSLAIHALDESVHKFLVLHYIECRVAKHQVSLRICLRLRCTHTQILDVHVDEDLSLNLDL